jgi:hypothetical protein
MRMADPQGLQGRVPPAGISVSGVPSKVLGLLMLAAAALLMAGLGFHLYTLPTRDSGGIAAIIEFLAEARPRDSLLVPRRDPAPEAAAWLDSVRRRDSVTTRGWAGPGVLAYATRAGDTSRVTLWRLTLAHGCPVVSRLRGTVVMPLRRLDSYYQVVRIEANCPRLAPVR